MKKNATHTNLTSSLAVKTVNELQYFVNNGTSTAIQDSVIIEEPLLVCITFINHTKQEKQTLDLTVMMRTPGFDHYLVRGLLFSEQIVNMPTDIVSIAFSDENEFKNQIEVTLANHVKVDWQKSSRSFVSQSSCGICGKSSLKALALKSTLTSDDSSNWLNKNDIVTYANELKAHQPLFASTGAVHGAGYIVNEKWVCIFEDVGRHNAVDKVIGSLWQYGKLRPKSILVLSGRVSFELMQKAVTAGIAVIIAIGAPSSLAISAATQFNITLIGFTKMHKFNVYSGKHRILDES